MNRNSFHPPRMKYAAMATTACTSRLLRYVSNSWPPRPMRFMIPLTTMPAGAKGESDPALAPLPTMMAMRNIGTAARPATAIAIGATSAALAILPGPSDDSALVTTKNMIGMRPTLPRQTCMARWATLSSVPFSCAWVKSSVTPVSVRNRAMGKPLKTAASVMPAKYTPMIHANASARMPTFSWLKQLTTMATISAPSDSQARFIR